MWGTERLPHLPHESDQFQADKRRVVDRLRDIYRQLENLKNTLLAAGIFSVTIPCHTQTPIDVHLGIATLSALQTVSTLPTSPLATARQFAGAQQVTAAPQHTALPMPSVSATSPSDLDPFLC